MRSYIQYVKQYIAICMHVYRAANTRLNILLTLSLARLSRLHSRNCIRLSISVYLNTAYMNHTDVSQELAMESSQHVLNQ
jgi:hypothetical protein